MSDENSGAVAVEAPVKKAAVKKAAGGKGGGKANAKAAKKAAGKKAVKKAAGGGGARKEGGNAKKVLQALAKTGPDKTMTRQQLAEKTEIAKGWSKLLGSPTKDAKDHGLEAQGLVKSVAVEGQRALGYYITAKGKAELAK